MDLSVFSSASQVAEAIRNRNITAARVVDLYFKQINKHNKKLNAIVTLDEKGARRRAHEADQALGRDEIWGPLHGVPVTIKDVFEVAGMRSTCSSPRLSGNVPEQDATAVARLRAAGAIIIGKTNMPEQASDFQTVSPIFGRANNPWNLNRTPGGSTGGGAVAVATGMSCLELGSDLSGSIRVPAHFCGVYGFIPTEDLVPRGGHLPRQRPGSLLGRFLRVGALARSIDDLRLCLSVIAGPDGYEPDLLPVKLIDSLAPPKDQVRVAWTEDFGGVPLADDVKGQLVSFVDNLAIHGYHIEHCAPPGFDFEAVRGIHREVFFATVGASLPAPIRLIGRYLGHVDAFSLDLQRYLQADVGRAGLTAILDRFLSDWDVWICPVSATPAFLHHKPSQRYGATHIYRKPIVLDGDRTVDYWVANTSFTIPFNVTGHPVVVAPMGLSREGLPIGLQIVGRRWDDYRLLNIAAQLTAIMPPWQIPPGYDDTAAAA